MKEEILSACEVAANSLAELQGTLGNGGVSTTAGSSATHAEGTIGNAFASGTGYPGLKQNEKNALRSEYGQPELTVYPNGTYELTTEPTMSDLPKDTVIFNEDQTKRVLNNKGQTGNAFSGGTGTSIDTSNLTPVREGTRAYELIKKFEPYVQHIDATLMSMSATFNSNYENMWKQLGVPQNISNISNKQSTQEIHFNTGDIVVQGVQDVNGFAKAVKSYFPNAMLQEIHKR